MELGVWGERGGDEWGLGGWGWYIGVVCGGHKLYLAGVSLCLRLFRSVGAGELMRGLVTSLYAHNNSFE